MAHAADQLPHLSQPVAEAALHANWQLQACQLHVCGEGAGTQQFSKSTILRCCAGGAVPAYAGADRRGGYSGSGGYSQPAAAAQPGGRAGDYGQARGAAGYAPGRAAADYPAASELLTDDILERDENSRAAPPATLQAARPPSTRQPVSWQPKRASNILSAPMSHATMGRKAKTLQRRLALCAHWEVM